jgi:hypothetical protein
MQAINKYKESLRDLKQWRTEVRDDQFPIEIRNYPQKYQGKRPFRSHIKSSTWQLQDIPGISGCSIDIFGGLNGGRHGVQNF